MTFRGGFFLFFYQCRYCLFSCKTVYGQAVILLISPDSRYSLNPGDAVRLATVVPGGGKHPLQPPDTVPAASVSNHFGGLLIRAIPFRNTAVCIKRRAAIDPLDAGLSLD